MRGRVSADPNNALGVVIEPVKRETPAFLRDLQAQVDAEGAAGQKHGRREDGAEVGSEEDSSSAGARGKLPRIAPESGKRTLTSADLLFGASEDTTEEREGAAAAAAGKEEVEGKGEAEGEEEDEREEGGKPSQEAGKDEEKVRPFGNTARLISNEPEFGGRSKNPFVGRHVAFDISTCFCILLLRVIAHA